MVVVAVLLVATGCGAQATPAPGPVAVLYAGSLVNLMEQGAGPGFDQTTGYRFQGFAGGSTALANGIKAGVRRADVFISASPGVNAGLTGPANGNWVDWYATFAAAPLVIGYNSKSRFAQALQTQPWYQVMERPGFRLGRTDPTLDPKGELTVRLVTAAARYYHQSNLEHALLGSDDNPAQVFPEEDLVGRLQAGQLDAGFFYSNEAVEAGIPYITPPSALDLSAEYTVTVVNRAHNEPGAVAFVRYLLGPSGRALLRQHGLTVAKPTRSGDASAVPIGLRSALRG